MSVSALIYLDKIPDKHRQRVMGVFSSQQNAWQAFSSLAGRAPYTTGTFRYSNSSLFLSALQQQLGVSKSIQIYSDTSFDIYIRWDIMDQLIF